MTIVSVCLLHIRNKGIQFLSVIIPHSLILLQTFSGSVTSGNITLPSTDHDVTYTIQVTASVEDGDNINEGVPSRDLMFSLSELGVSHKLNYLSEFYVCFTIN